MQKESQHTISILVENKFGVLARIAGLFSARGFNINSLSVGETHDPLVSRMTVVVKGDEKTLEQVEKQLNKLIDVIKVQNYAQAPHIERDLALIKVRVGKQNRAEILQVVEIFRSKVVDISEEYIVVEVTGDEEKIAALVNVLRPFGIVEMSRTGTLALARGNNILSV